MKKKIFFILFAFLISGSANCQQNNQPNKNGNSKIEYAVESETEEKIQNLKERQDLVLESFSRYFNAALGIFGVLGIIISIFSYFTMTGDSHVRKLLSDQMTKELQLMQNFSGNIGAINGLINAMKEVIDSQAKAQQMLATINTLKDKDQAKEEMFEKEVEDLNKSTMKLSKEFRRRSHNQISFQRRIANIVEKYEILNSSTDLHHKINANAYYVIALHYRISNDYNEALKSFSKAITLCGEHIDQDDSAKYPLLKEYGVDLNKWLNKLKNVCYYHSAIIDYNLGSYDSAIQNFKSAIQFDNTDFESMIYIPEAMFLGALQPFNTIVINFQKVIDDLEKSMELDKEQFSSSRNELLASAYLKLGNCYLGSSLESEYRVNKDLTKCQLLFEKALSLNPKSSVLKFSLGQALYLIDREKGQSSRDRYFDLFFGAFKQIKSSIGKITEAKILMMYYYILAICVEYGEIENEAPQVYLLRIYELRTRLPEDERLRIYSPMTKNDLIVEDFVKEVELFQEGVKLTEGNYSSLANKKATLGFRSANSARRSLR